MKKAHSTIAPVIVDLRFLKFRRLDAKGNELSAGAKKGHVITHFPQLGLMFDVRKPKTVNSLAEAQAVAKKVTLLGRKGEWVVGEDVEITALINRRFREPAIDPLAAPNMPSGGWIYTAKPLEGSSGRAWFVNLSCGVVFWSFDAGEGLVVPVLRVPASQ